MEKQFTVAGTSRRNGVVKFRFSNDLKGRIPMLIKTGHTEINLVELPAAMTKAAAIAYLEAQDFTVAAEPAQDTAPTPATADAVEPDAVVTQADIDQLRADMAAEGEAVDDITDDFLVEVLAREDSARIEAIMATLPKRTPQGHFVKKTVLRAQAEALASV